MIQSELALPTGRLIAGDPAEIFGDARPLGPTLAGGVFQVTRTSAAIELRLADARPVRWEGLPGFATPSGCACLLDARAVDGYSDLGDEPIDEFELLDERLTAARAGGGPVSFAGLLVFPDVAGVTGVSVGYAADGRPVRVVLELAPGASGGWPRPPSQ